MSEPNRSGGQEGPGQVSESPWTDSAAGRIVGALVAPKATFESIRRRPTWVVALVALILGAAAFQTALMTKIDYAEVVRQQIEAQGQDTGQLDEEQLERLGTFSKLAPACGILVMPVGYAAFGLVLMVLVNLAGGESDFHRAMAIATHGTMPLLVMYLLSVLVLLAGGEVDPQRMQLEGGILASNLAVLAPEGASPALVVALAAVDLFSIWNVILLVLGVTIAAGLGSGAGAAVIGVLWVLWVGFRMGMALLGSGIGG